MKSPALIETLEIARHDGRGRRLAGAGEREALMAACQASGLTQRAFWEREGINQFTLAGWMRKKRLAAVKPGSPVQRRLAFEVSAN